MTETAFQAAMAEVGLISRDAIIADGRLRRFRVDGDNGGSRNGWYVLYSDGVPSGAFGSWKVGIKGTWCARKKSDLTPAEHTEHKRRMDATRKDREAEDRAIKKAAREKATMIWTSLPSAPDNHPYLMKKGVKNHGIRLSKGDLVIPLRDSAGTLHSLEFIKFIDGEGVKRFQFGGRKKGCYFPIGHVGDTICIAEGYATAASIHEATGHAVAVAFDAGNLLPVAQSLRQKFPTIRIIICADNDVSTPGNPGVREARKAAAAIGGLIAVAGSALSW